ncbi:MAG TPA: DUF1232 domain-containing protein [Solirubrobacteraceae bacterium]|nr:DUF1232 domain-containing protein [Solirubrobacteraceae bacterium]
MPTWAWLAVATLAIYASFVLALLVAGRREQARALAVFAPDCALLCRRLLRDPRVPRARKLALAATVAYLLLPFDVVPDFVPVAGQLDDAVLLAFVLRGIARSAGTALLAEHWPGTAGALAQIIRLTGASASGPP